VVRHEAADVAALAEHLRGEPSLSLLYLAAENRSGELSELLPMHKVRTEVVYQAAPKTSLATETVEALRRGLVSEVLHYSRRLAEYYLALADAAGVGAEALAPRHLCLSEQVAAPLRAAGAARVEVAGEPREDALLGLLEADRSQILAPGAR
jgi:uroporphyrinogen-III synthase